jgi:FkbM family methyltransferase
VNAFLSNPTVRRAGREVRRRGLKVLHGIPVEAAPVTPSIGSQGVPLGDILTLLYPDTADQSTLSRDAYAVLGRDTVRTTVDLRRLLGGLDRQRYPSPVTVRFRGDDVMVTQLDDFPMALDLGDRSVSTAIRDSRAYEPHVTAVIKDLCKPGMTAVDIGANIGFHTMVFSRAVGDAGSVIAVEPNSENCRLLLTTLKEAGVDNVELVPLALDAARGWAYFSNHVGSNGGFLNASAREYVDGGGSVVPTFPLDEIIREKVDFLKIDVEGAEARVVRGGEKTIEQWRPIIVAEFSCEMLRRVSGVEPIDYLSWFADLGYRIHIIPRTPHRRMSPVSPTALLANWNDDLRIEDLLLVP